MGLAVSLAVVILIGSYVAQQYEVAHESPDWKRTFVLGSDEFLGLTYWDKEELEMNIPEVEAARRVALLWQPLIREGDDLLQCSGMETDADFLKLVGNSNKDDTRGEDAAIDDNTAVYYVTACKGSSVKRFNEAGWNFSFLGARNKTSNTATGAYNTTVTDASKCSVSEWIGKPALNQIMSSTAYKPNVAGTSFQYFCLMSTFTSAYMDGRLSLSYAQYLQGVEVRCIRQVPETK